MVPVELRGVTSTLVTKMVQIKCVGCGKIILKYGRGMCISCYKKDEYSHSDIGKERAQRIKERAKELETNEPKRKIHEHNKKYYQDNKEHLKECSRKYKEKKRLEKQNA